MSIVFVYVGIIYIFINYKHYNIGSSYLSDCSCARIGSENSSTWMSIVE